MTKQKIHTQVLHTLEIFTTEHCKFINLRFETEADN